MGEIYGIDLRKGREARESFNRQRDELRAGIGRDVASALLVKRLDIYKRAGQNLGPRCGRIDMADSSEEMSRTVPARVLASQDGQIVFGWRAGEVFSTRFRQKCRDRDERKVRADTMRGETVVRGREIGVIVEEGTKRDGLDAPAICEIVRRRSE